MKRFTYFDGENWCLKINDTEYSDFEFIDRLAAYEDTGLEHEEYKKHADSLKKLDIEHMHDLILAEKEGRLVVLPCKFGDTVYFPILGKIIEKQIFSIVSFFNSQRIYCSGTSEYFRPEDIGKTVFLTREEAEAALRKRGRQTMRLIDAHFAAEQIKNYDRRNPEEGTI